jgi:aryl-alcohol dehydrogenase-like predicted oxidoreductase
METARLGPLTVSRLALVAMLMGGKTSVDEAHRMLDRFVDAGGTFVDTADTYGRGESERVLAPWLARRRDDVVLATKVRFETSERPARDSRPTASAPRATRACGAWAWT